MFEGAAFARDLGWLAAFSGLFGLDRRGAFQTMISQPLVAAPALGFFYGDLQTGLWIGSILQLLFMSSFLFGASVPPNETVACMAIAGIVLIYGRHAGEPATPALWALAILFGFPLSAAGRRVEIHIDRHNLRLCRLADEAAKAAAPRALSALPVRALARAALLNMLLITPFVCVGTLGLLAIGTQMQPVFTASLTALSVYVLPALGLAVALSTLRRRRALALAWVAFVTVLVVLNQGLA